jgi:hypothetical protein
MRRRRPTSPGHYHAPPLLRRSERVHRLQQRNEEEQRAEEAASLSPPLLSPVIAALTPVRSGFHDFLDEEDGGRLMRVSSAFTATVLTGFVFRERVFRAESASHLRRLKSLYEGNGLHISSMDLDESFNEPLMDSTGESLLPSSLIALALGCVKLRSLHTIVGPALSG